MINSKNHFFYFYSNVFNQTLLSVQYIDVTQYLIDLFWQGLVLVCGGGPGGWSLDLNRYRLKDSHLPRRTLLGPFYSFSHFVSRKTAPSPKSKNYLVPHPLPRSPILDLPLKRLQFRQMFPTKVILWIKYTRMYSIVCCSVEENRGGKVLERWRHLLFSMS